MDHRGECDEDDDTPSDDVCARVRDAGRCEYNRDNCDHLVRPEEGCCPVCGKIACVRLATFEIITTTTPTIPYYTINPSYCWMPDLENQEWWVKKLFDGMPTLPTHPAFIPV